MVLGSYFLDISATYFDILDEFQDPLGNYFLDILFVFQDLLGSSFLDLIFDFQDFPNTLLFLYFNSFFGLLWYLRFLNISCTSGFPQYFAL